MGLGGDNDVCCGCYGNDMWIIVQRHCSLEHAVVQRTCCVMYIDSVCDYDIVVERAQCPA